MTTMETHASSYGRNSDRKKLSWIYRRKKRLQRPAQQTNNTENNSQQQNKKARIIVRNLPFKATEADIRQLYERFGNIDEVNLLKHPDGKLVGCGFIQFQRVEDASRAIFNTNKQYFLGRIINSSWAIPKSKFCEKLEGTSLKNEEETNLDESVAEVPQIKDVENKPAIPRRTSMMKQEQRKIYKERNRKKRARIIVRNLAFQAEEEDLRQYFSQFGNIEDIQILTKDGRKRGCAFIQFELVQSAAKAIHYANLKPILDRQIVVDWAVPKNKFSKQNEGDDKDEVVSVKVEKDNEDELQPNETKTVKESGSDVEEIDTKDEYDESHGDLEENNEDERSSNAEDNEEDNEEDKEEISMHDKEISMHNEEQDIKRPRRESHDISEGKTVFLKNVPFSINNQQLKQFMEQFGPVFYALVCIDSLTEHSKGTAFVKFKYMVDAEKCLSAGRELQMEGQTVEVYKALERDEVENKTKERKTKERDTRNLYLVKEGVILAGSPAAVGVSATDMARRLQLEQWKSQMLRNLNMFVARTRLVVHNLPPSLDDAKLRKIFQQHSHPNAVIREARVMRDLRNLDANGVGKSKEYGFVSFGTHEDALHALRSINNNPNVFNANRRPIVAFSIENRIMINAKQKRIERSRQNNPLWPANRTKRSGEHSQGGENMPAKKPRFDKLGDLEAKPFAGTVGKPGENKLRSKFNLKNQAALHKEAVKKAKKQKKSERKTETIKKERANKKREVKAKQGQKVNSEDVHFNKLVSSYRNKLQSLELKKSKWYESQ